MNIVKEILELKLRLNKILCILDDFDTSEKDKFAKVDASNIKQEYVALWKDLLKYFTQEEVIALVKEAVDPKLDKPERDGIWVVKKEDSNVVYIDLESEALVGLKDKYFQFEQIFPAKEWTIRHNMGKNPSVTTTDTAGTVMIGSVHYSSDRNSLTVYFNYPVSGKAELN